MKVETKKHTMKPKMCSPLYYGIFPKQLILSTEKQMKRRKIMRQPRQLSSVLQRLQKLLIELIKNDVQNCKFINN